MHVAILTHTFWPVVGGAEVGIHELAVRLAERHHVTVVTSMPENYADAFIVPLPESLPYDVLRYDAVQPRGGSRRDQVRLLLGWREFRVLRALHRRRRLDALNIHFAAPFGLAALWVRLLLGVRTVVSLIGRSDVYADLGPARRRHLRLVLRVAHRAVQISGYCLAGLRGGDRVPVLPYGVDTARFRPDPARRPGAVVGLASVQRLSPVKRVDLLLDVAGELERRRPGRYRLTVMGKGSEEGALRRKIVDDGLVNVTLTGFVPDDEVARVLADSDLFVAHTMSETFGVMFVQAMAAGLPIVAARATSVPYVIGDPENGSLVEPFDVAAFADAVERLADDDEARSAVAVRNRRTATEQYDWDGIASRLEGYLSR